MNAVVISVDYAPELSVTLSRNARHFDRVVVVSSYADRATADVVKGVHNADLLATDAFHRNPHRPFAKDTAIVEGLQYLGRHGWTMLLDADILLPENVSLWECKMGNLYAPRRRMVFPLPPFPKVVIKGDWTIFPVQPDKVFAGYCQIFHCDDPNVQPWPNYPVEDPYWFSDTVFQDRWPPEKRIRTPWEVLHIGDPAGVNWYGRAPEARILLQSARRANRRSWKSKW